MTRHLLTAAIAALWLAMVFLLWRAETGLGSSSSPVPLDLVLDRILNAADPSQLRLLSRGREIGQLRWVASIHERAADPSDSAPEGMVRAVEGYRLDIDLNLNGETPDQRWRVLAQLEVGPDKSIRDVLVRWMQRPKAWEVRMHAGSDLVEVVEEDGRSVRRSQSFRLSDIQRLKDALGPVAALLPSPSPAPPPSKQPADTLSQWLDWAATEEPLLAGRHKVRTFKVRARLLGKFGAVAHVSRAGELLRVALPDQLLLASTALPGLDTPAHPRQGR